MTWWQVRVARAGVAWREWLLGAIGRVLGRAGEWLIFAEDELARLGAGGKDDKT